MIVSQHKRIVMIEHMPTIAERLKKSRAEKGWSQSRLAAAAGVSQGTIGNIESGARDGLVSLIAIADALGVNYKWLAEGKGCKWRASEVPAVYLVDNPDFPAIRRVQLKVQAGVTGFSVQSDAEDAAPIVFRRQWFESNGYQPDRLVAVRVKGDSMEPRLFCGDTIVINTAQTTPVDGAVFAVNYEGEAIVKRLVRDAGQWWLSSDNPDHARYPRKLANGDAIIIGEVVHRQSEHI